MIYPIRHLPQVIPIGVQTESGVEAVGFDVKAWLDEFDSLDLTVWPTRPGESAAYPAADVELVGTVLYWHPNGADTAIEGVGKVEVLGVTGDKRKLSGWCDTMVRATSLATTQEPPEAARPWVDEVLTAADEAKKQADRAKEIVDNLSGGAISGSVRFDMEQVLTEEQKAQARKNIGADTGGVNFTTDKTLTLDPETQVLSVNTVDAAEKDDPRPITSQGVYNEFAVINALLKTI